MNPVLEKLKGLEARYLLMILAGIIAVFAALDYVLVMRLQLSLVDSFNSRIVQLNKDIVDLSTNKQRLVQYRAQLDLARQTRKRFDAMVHSKGDVPAVLNSVSSIANENGVKIDQVVPQDISTDPLVKNEDGQYYSMIIAVRVRCGYHQFGKFINQLERQRLFWQMEALEIAADPKDAQRQDIRMNMKILILEK